MRLHVVRIFVCGTPGGPSQPHAASLARKSRALCGTEQPAPPQTILRQEDTLHAECHASCCMHVVRTGVELLRQNIVRPFDLGCARPTRDWRRNTLCSASHSAQTATASAVAMIFGQGCTGRCRWLHFQNIVKRPVLGRHVPLQVGSLLRLLCAALALTSSIQNITAPQPSADRLCSVRQSIDGYHIAPNSSAHRRAEYGRSLHLHAARIAAPKVHATAPKESPHTGPVAALLSIRRYGARELTYRRPGTVPSQESR